jgi:hypothetical protein
MADGHDVLATTRVAPESENPDGPGAVLRFLMSTKFAASVGEEAFLMLFSSMDRISLMENEDLFSPGRIANKGLYVVVKGKHGMHYFCLSFCYSWVLVNHTSTMEGSRVMSQVNTRVFSVPCVARWYL